MSFYERLKFYFNNFVEKVNLNTEKKSKLIEILLLVGTILVALKTLQDFLLIVFMFFIFSSIFYYIIIQNDNSKPSCWDNIHVLVIAATFSMLVNVNLFINLWSDFVRFSPPLGIILFSIYYLVLTFLLYAALIKR